MKGKKSKRAEYTSIKIRTEHYNMVKENKAKTGINIDFFVGQAIVEKLQKKS